MSNRKYNIRYVAADDVAEHLKQSLERTHFKEHLQLHTIIIEDGYVVPAGLDNSDWKLQGGVLSSDFKYVATSAYHNCKCDLQKQYELANIIESSECVIFIGQLYDCWGHVLTDNLSKVWYLFTSECQTYIAKGYRIVFTTIGNHALKGYVSDLLSLAGISIDDCWQVTKNTRFKRVVIPDSSFIFDGEDRYFTAEFIDVRNRICQHIDAYACNKLYNKVYLTRTHLPQTGRDCGEISIENFYKKIRYAIVAPEEHSVVEQLSIVRNATSVAVTEGSIAHITMFCKQGTKVHLLMKADYVNTYQTAINELAGLDVMYIPIHHSSATHRTHPWWGPFFLYVTPALLQSNNVNQFLPPPPHIGCKKVIGIIWNLNGGICISELSEK